jgi:translocation and assembly module TamB
MAKDVEIKSSVFDGKINAHAEVEQKRNRPHVAARVKIDDAKINISSIPDVGEGDSNIGLHIDLELGPKIHLFNRYLYNMWLAGNLQVRGSTRYPRIDGAIKATKGTISYLSTPFNIEEAEVAWPTAGTFIPHVKFAAMTKFGRYNITAKANGPVSADTLHISLTSDPPASENMIMKMLTLKTDLLDSGDNDYSGLLEAGLQMTFLGDVEDFIKRALTLDDFKIYSGSTRSGLGFDIDSVKVNNSSQEERNKYNILVSKYLTKHILVGYTTSLDQQYHSVFAEYNIGQKLNLDFSINEKQEKWYGVMYRTTF